MADKSHSTVNSKASCLLTHVIHLHPEFALKQASQREYDFKMVWDSSSYLCHYNCIFWSIAFLFKVTAFSDLLQCFLYFLSIELLKGNFHRLMRNEAELVPFLTSLSFPRSEIIHIDLLKLHKEAKTLTIIF